MKFRLVATRDLRPRALASEAATSTAATRAVVASTRTSSMMACLLAMLGSTTGPCFELCDAHQCQFLSPRQRLCNASTPRLRRTLYWIERHNGFGNAHDVAE